MHFNNPADEPDHKPVSLEERDDLEQVLCACYCFPQGILTTDYFEDVDEGDEDSDRRDALYSAQEELEEATYRLMAAAEEMRDLLGMTEDELSKATDHHYPRQNLRNF